MPQSHPQPTFPTLTPEEISTFCNDVAQDFGKQPCEIRVTGLQEAARHVAVRHVDNQKYVRFQPPEIHGSKEAFYALWQPSALRRKAPLLVHLPGYGAGFTLFPELQAAGYHTLHISPMGYVTPEGRQPHLQREGHWPVLADTVKSVGANGYRDMLRELLWAITWALQQSDVETGIFGLFGTSQGGGLALLLASCLRERLSSVIVAHLPFLTGFDAAPNAGSYQLAASAIAKSTEHDAAARALLYFDTLSHAHRLDMPTLLTSGGQDKLCPTDSVKRLFEKLPGIRALHETPAQGHVYTTEALRLTKTWFDIYL